MGGGLKLNYGEELPPIFEMESYHFYNEGRGALHVTKNSVAFGPMSFNLVEQLSPLF